ncbi:MAG: DUF2752 domain-containing protein [Ruminococcus sp.]|nr:DUF2752 domain-containing protein [Ruminococcus sp.]
MKMNIYKLKKIIVALILGTAYFIFVKLTDLGIPCPINLMSGNRIQCPGCGISRMFMRLAELDIAGAFHCNQAIFSMLPVWGICIILWLFDKGEKFLKAVGIISVILLILFGIWRNLP